MPFLNGSHVVNECMIIGEKSNQFFSNTVPAKIASFDDKFTATYKEDVKLPCLAVGVPAPEVTWKIRDATLQPSDRLRQLPEGSLFIKEVDRADAGEYSCYVENSFGHDTVTHQLIVHGKKRIVYDPSHVSTRYTLLQKEKNGTRSLEIVDYQFRQGRTHY